MQGDVKILTKSLMYQMRQLMPHLIYVDNKGFIPGRSLYHYVRYINDLQHFLTETGGRYRGVPRFCKGIQSCGLDLHV